MTTDQKIDLELATALIHRRATITIRDGAKTETVRGVIGFVGTNTDELSIVLRCDQSQTA